MKRENLHVGSHLYSNERWDKGYPDIRKPCKCPLGTKCGHPNPIENGDEKDDAGNDNEGM